MSVSAVLFHILSLLFSQKTKLDKEQIQALQDFIDHCEE